MTDSSGLPVPPTPATVELIPGSDRAFLELVRSSPFGIYVVDADFRLAAVSDGSRRVFKGIDPLLGRDFAEILNIVWPEPFATEALTRFRHTLTTGEPFHSPTTTEQRGNIAVVESYDWQIARVPTPDGRHGVVCHFYETTARVNAEQDAYLLAELAERLRIAKDSNQLLKDVVQVIGVYLRADRCFINQIYEADDRWTIADDYHAAGRSIAGEYRLSDYDPESRAALRRGVVDVSADTKTDVRSAARFATAYEPLGVRAHVLVPLLRNGRWVANFIVTSERPRPWQAREVSLLETVADRAWSAVEKLRFDAELAEERRATQHAEAALQLERAAGQQRQIASEARAELVKQATQVGFWFCDLPFDRLLWDARVKDHFWLPQDADVTIDTLYRQLHPDDRERTRRAIQESIEGHTPYDIEHRTVSAQGAQKWIRAIGRTFYDEKSQPIRFDGVTLDITDRKHAEQALRENDQRKDEFLAMLAHELRNPLAPIRHAAEILKLRDADDDQTRWAAGVIDRQAHHLTRLIDDLLDVSRITRGKIALQREVVSLSTILERAVEAHRPAAEARRQQMLVGVPQEPVKVVGDVTRLVQVVSNLLSNAI